MARTTTSFASTSIFGGTVYIYTDEDIYNVYASVEVPKGNYYYCTLTLQVSENGKPWQNLVTKSGYALREHGSNQPFHAQFSGIANGKSRLTRVYCEFRSGNNPYGPISRYIYTKSWRR